MSFSVRFFFLGVLCGSTMLTTLSPSKGDFARGIYENLKAVWIDLLQGNCSGQTTGGANER